ncbi:MAG: glycoside hydrolase family 13 protein [Pleomorphochaeta sp.]
MENINDYFDFGINKTYVDPLYPSKGDDINIKFLAKGDVDYIRLNYKKNGTWNFIILEKAHNIDNIFSIFQCVLMLEEDSKLFFTIEINNSIYYFSKLGLSVAHPSDRDCFSLLIGLEVPCWVSNSTCYQIFPDRFRDGDENNKVETGEYFFDGSYSTEMSFNQKPLNFDEGRCLDFFNGDLKGVELSLTYLKNLGINCIYLNPIGVSKTTHRYDCCDFFSVDPKLGGDQALISLINEAHKLSIKVIVDISINHTGIEHPWFKEALRNKNSKEAKYYYIDENNEIAFWQNVKTLPQLNYNNQELRDLIYRDQNSVIKKYLKSPFNQDGWRFDVADEVGRKDNDQFNDEIWREVRKSIKEENPNAYILAESWIDSSDHLQGDQWDATMNYIGCSRPIRRWMGEEDRFTCFDWGHSPRKVNQYNARDLMIALQSQLNSIPSQFAQFQMNLIDSHDTPRLHNNKEVFEFNLYQSSVMLMYSLPGMPSVYYGDEIGLDGQMRSVEMSRYPMVWDEEKWNKDFYNLYKILGQFREDYKEVLFLGSYKILNIDDNIFTIVRYNEDKVIFVVLNKEEKERTLNLDIPYLLLDTIDKVYFDTKVENNKIYLKKRENAIIVFNRKKIYKNDNK